MSFEEIEHIEETDEVEKINDEEFHKAFVKRKKRNKIIKISLLVAAVILGLMFINFLMGPKIGRKIIKDGNIYVVLENKSMFSNGKVVLIQANDDEVFIPDTITVMKRMTPDTFKVVSVYQENFKGKSLHLPRYFEKFTGSYPIDDEIEEIAYTGEFYLENIYVSEENERYDSRENCGCLIDSETNTLLMSSNHAFIPSGIKAVVNNGLRRYFWGKETKFTIPDSIEVLDDLAFGRAFINIDDYVDEKGNNWRVDYLDFGSVKEIGYLVIYDSHLQNNATVILPKTLEKIDAYALCYSGRSAEFNIFYKGSVADWKKVRILDNRLEVDELHLYKDPSPNFYYYSESEPEEKGKYWHFNNNNQPIVWN